MSDVAEKTAPETPKRVITIIEIIATVFGIIIQLISFLADHNQWVHDLQTLRWFSGVGYVLIALSVVWIAFFDPHVTIKWKKASLAGFTVVTGLYFVWVGTWITLPARTPWIIDGMDGISMWSVSTDSKGSQIQTKLEDGRHGKVMRADFNLIRYGYVTVIRNLNPQILAGSNGIGLAYKSTGEPNTIELKLIYQPNANGKEAVFSVVWDQVTGEKGWTVLQASYSQFICWTDTGCKVGDTFDISKVGRIDIAISNKAGEEPGSGSVWIDEIIAFP